MHELPSIKIFSEDPESYLVIKDICMDTNSSAYNTSMKVEVSTKFFRWNESLFSSHSSEFFKFTNDLVDLYDRLSGEATITSYDFPGKIVVKCNKDNGHILIFGELTIWDLKKTRLEFYVETDQSFLHSFIQTYRNINENNFQSIF